MPEPFKNFFNQALIDGMAAHLGRQWDGFDKAGFIAAAGADFGALELKQRSDQIQAALGAHLPEDFEHAARILRGALHPDEGLDDLTGATIDERGVRGWAILPMGGTVGDRGLDHFDLALDLLKEMTKRFTSESAIRMFLLANAPRTLATLATWTRDPNRHVRRLVSEGTRPRLPWSMRLPAFVADPGPVLPLLEALRDDPEEYVRRSVANNLNDIAKDHPDLVADIAQRWLRDATPARAKLVRHACRTLVKQGHEATLKALGYGPAQVRLDRLAVLTPTVAYGTALEFETAIISEGAEPQDLIVDYIIHHRKANGGLSPKVFKWKTATLLAGATLSGTRRHPIRPITTRVYYPGTHRLEIVVNGAVIGDAAFELEM